MKLANLRFLPRAIDRKAFFLSLASLLGIPIYFIARRLGLLATSPEDFSVALTGGIITIALLVTSLLRFIPDFKEKKSASISVLYPITLIMFSVLMAAASNLINDLVYIALYYLLLGILLFLNEVREVVTEQTLGATLLDKVTHDSRNQKLPRLGEESVIARAAFQGHLRINKGEALLAKCAFIQDGRLLVHKLIEHANYVIYISADRPHTTLMEELRQFQSKLYCIDCFTNVYGFGEFREIRGESRCYTLKPTTTKQLHEVLREVRRRIVAEMYYGKDWESLRKDEIEKVAVELASKDATLEREQNVWIIYDSISSLAPIFEMEHLLRFLTHDTTVDTLIGRNTILLVKDGAVEEDTIAKLESVCEHIFSVAVEQHRISIGIDRSDHQNPSYFYMDI